MCVHPLFEDCVTRSDVKSYVVVWTPISRLQSLLLLLLLLLLLPPHQPRRVAVYSRSHCKRQIIVKSTTCVWFSVRHRRHCARHRLIIILSANDRRRYAWRQQLSNVPSTDWDREKRDCVNAPAVAPLKMWIRTCISIYIYIYGRLVQHIESWQYDAHWYYYSMYFSRKSDYEVLQTWILTRLGSVNSGMTYHAKDELYESLDREGEKTCFTRGSFFALTAGK
jgi:hypothetical protein